MSLPTSPGWPSGLQDYTIVRNRRQEPVGLRLMLLRRWESGPNLDLRVIVNKAGKAVHVLHRFHIMGHLSKAIDEVHAQEAKQLNEKGFELVLTKTRWPLLNRAENLTDKQETKLSDVLKYNLRSVRSYLLKTVFQRHCRGLQHQSETDYQKGVRFPDLLCGRNRLVSCAWRFTCPTCPENYPRTLLTRQEIPWIYLIRSSLL